jgi:5-methylthioadenosine/S-adenosylhomocysteine deaminase
VILRPDAIVFPDGIKTGLEVCWSEGVIAEIRPWTTEVRDENGLLLSPAFVNAHSHFEYYDLIGAIEGSGYWEWIRELTERKATRDREAVRKVAQKAAALNVHTGVYAVAEWSDWEGSDEAITSHGLQGCIFQELITFREWSDPAGKLSAARDQAERNMTTTFVTPHAPYTVTPEVISALAAAGEPLSIHAAETQAENDFYQCGKGPIRRAYDTAGICVDPPGVTSIQYLDLLGALSKRTQLVHVCAATNEDVDLIAERGCSVAHCPRSNEALGCPAAPIGELLDRGVRVGLGMDSAASSGMIDMFAEMREAITVSHEAGRPLTSEEVWRMATNSSRVAGLEPNEVGVGTSPFLLLVRSEPTFDALLHACPRDLRPIPGLL